MSGETFRILKKAWKIARIGKVSWKASKLEEITKKVCGNLRTVKLVKMTRKIVESVGIKKINNKGLNFSKWWG